jgi:TolB-like protein
MLHPSGSAVFLSYASQDAAAARRIRDALQAAGIEAWLDETGLGGGDAWDAEIRRRIRECALFVPIISAHTEQRLEGYFRLEWRLAEQRSHQMALGKPFFVPVVIDTTPDDGARVPNAFVDVQWTRLVGGEGATAFARRVKSLLTQVDVPGTADGHEHLASASVSMSVPVSRSAPTAAAAMTRRPAWTGLAIFAVLLAGGVVLWMYRGQMAEGLGSPDTTRTAVAVLPFANLTGDASKDYLGDGMAEELINTLAKVQGLKVPARTSTFAYKGRNTDIRQIAKDLGVGTILEGSVRAAGQRIRITAQLINAQDGLHLWSETYDEEFTDLFKLQDKLATQIAKALQPSLSNEAAATMSRTVGTKDVEAYNLALQGWSLVDAFARDGLPTAEALFQQAVQRDPRYARAWAGLAAVHFNYSNLQLLDAERLEAERDARQALTLDPADMRALSVMALISVSRNAVEYDGYMRAALASAPADAAMDALLASTLTRMGRLRDVLIAARKAYTLAPAHNAAIQQLAAALSLNGLDAEAAGPLATFRALSGANPTRIYNMLVFRTAIRERQVDAATDLLVAVARPGVVDRTSLTLVVGAIADPAQRPAAIAVKSRFYPSVPAPKSAADVPLRWRSDSAAACMASYAYTLAGALDAAYDLANRCLPASIGVINEALWFPDMRPFRRDPRFADYIDRLGLHLIEYWQKYGPPDDCELKSGKLTCH